MSDIKLILPDRVVSGEVRETLAKLLPTTQADINRLKIKRATAFSEGWIDKTMLNERGLEQLAKFELAKAETL